MPTDPAPHLKDRSYLGSLPRTLDESSKGTVEWVSSLSRLPKNSLPFYRRGFIFVSTMVNESVAILAGIGLAAACGFRVFVPLFIASLAANMGFEAFGDLNFRELLGADYDWLGTTPVTIALGVATVVEVAAYYIPWVDNLLDSIATPASVFAGTFITSAFMPEFLGDGSAKWIASVVAGGGTAGLVQTASVLTRGASSATTGGVGNPAVATAELGGATLTAGLVVLVPIIAGLCVFVFLIYVLRALWRFFRRRRSMRV